MKLEDNVFNDLPASARGAPCGAAAGNQLGRGLPTGGLRRAAGASARRPRLRGDRRPLLAGLVEGAVYQRNFKCYYKFRVPKRGPSTGDRALVDAVGWKYLTDNPASNVKPPRRPN
jgi:hypothetical protein